MQEREIPKKEAESGKPGTSKTAADDDSKPRISKLLKGLKFEEATDEQMKALKEGNEVCQAIYRALADSEDEEESKKPSKVSSGG